MSRGPWLVRPRPVEQPRLRVFLCPFIGGGSTYWSRWWELAPSDVEVVVYLLPGRERRVGEPPLRSMSAVVSELTSASEAYLRAPFVMFGHSSGADIAFEMSHQLRERLGVAPTLLAVSSAMPPHLPRPPDRVSELPTSELVERLVGIGGSPRGVLRNKEYLRLMEATLRADCEVIESVRYRPRDPLECDLVALCGEDDPVIPRAQMRRWREQAAGRFTLAAFPGGHFYFSGREHDVVRVLLAEAGYAELAGGDTVAADREPGSAHTS